MKQTLKKNLPILTADGFRLGQVETLYHRIEPAQPQLKLFASYVMVVNMTIGDEFYVPTHYIDESKADETAVWLTLTKEEVGTKQLTSLPPFIAGNNCREETLDSATPNPEIGKKLENIMPLPPYQTE